MNNLSVSNVCGFIGIAIGISTMNYLGFSGILFAAIFGAVGGGIGGAIGVVIEHMKKKTD